MTGSKAPKPSDMLEAMLADLFGAAAGEGEPSDPASEAALLVGIREKLLEDHKFAPGQILRLKIRTQSFRSLPESPSIFMGYLEKPFSGLDLITSLEDANSSLAAQHYNSVIAYLKNGMYFRHLVDSREYEPHPDFQDMG